MSNPLNMSKTSLEEFVVSMAFETPEPEMIRRRSVVPAAKDEIFIQMKVFAVLQLVGSNQTGISGLSKAPLEARISMSAQSDLSCPAVIIDLVSISTITW